MKIVGYIDVDGEKFKIEVELEPQDGGRANRDKIQDILSGLERTISEHCGFNNTDWSDIKHELRYASISTSYQVPKDEDKNEYYETIDQPYGAEYDSSVSDDEIIKDMYNHICRLKTKNNIFDSTPPDVITDKFYVRVYPEIVLRSDGSKKDSYMRLQFVDKTKVIVRS